MEDNKVPCEVYSRIVGYLRPVQNWNDGKKQEFADRKPFAVTHVPGQAILTNKAEAGS
jgi:hypothetical protein